jgi:hypothetical protein
LSQIEAVATKAASYDPVRAALTVIMAPFWLLGMIAGILWLAGSWMWAAGVTGFADARRRAGSEL